MRQLWIWDNSKSEESTFNVKSWIQILKKTKHFHVVVHLWHGQLQYSSKHVCEPFLQKCNTYHEGLKQAFCNVTCFVHDVYMKLCTISNICLSKSLFFLQRSVIIIHIVTPDCFQLVWLPLQIWLKIGIWSQSVHYSTSLH